MKTNFQQFIASLFIAVFAAGCASAPSKFYTLSSTAKADAVAAVNCAIVVGPVTVTPLVDRPQFTVQVAPNRVAIDEFNRWAEPLNSGIARAVAGNLSAQLGTPRVASVSLANFNADYRVTLDIQRFDSLPDQSVHLEVVWVVRKANGNVSLSGRTIADESAKGDFAALAAAHSRALAKVSADIAGAIRSGTETKP